MKRVKKSIVINLSLLLGMTALNIGFGQTKLPDLGDVEMIQGEANNVGYWGDGKVYVVELWGTWCGPCIKNIPNLTALYDKYKNRGLTVVGYSWEDPKKS